MSSRNKALATLPRGVQERIVPRIRDLANNPRPSDSKKIRGADHVCRIRIGNKRVVYTIFDDSNYRAVYITDVSHRKDAYRP